MLNYQTESTEKQGNKRKESSLERSNDDIEQASSAKLVRKKCRANEHDKNNVISRPATTDQQGRIVLVTERNRLFSMICKSKTLS